MEGSGAADDIARSGDDAVRILRNEKIDPWVAQLPRAAEQASAASREDLVEFAHQAACAVAQAVADAPGTIDLRRIETYVDTWAPMNASPGQRELLVAEIEAARDTIELAGLSVDQLAELADTLCRLVDAAGQL